MRLLRTAGWPNYGLKDPKTSAWWVIFTRGTVTAVLPGLQAAFVDIGQERTAFLQARDMMDPGAEEDGGGSSRGRRRFQSQPPIQKLIKKGDEAIV